MAQVLTHLFTGVNWTCREKRRVGQIVGVKVSYRAELTPGGSHVVRVREGSCFSMLLLVGQTPPEFKKHLLRNGYSSFCAEFRSGAVARQVARALSKLGKRSR